MRLKTLLSKIYGMMKLFFSLLTALVVSFPAIAQKGYKIDVQIDGFQGDTIFLAYYLGDKQYIRDTVTAAAKGRFTFSGEEALPGGLYLVVLPPKNDFFQVVISQNEQHFALATKQEDMVTNMRVQGSEDNKSFYDYLRFLNEKRPLAEKLRKAMDEAGDNAEKKKDIQNQLDQLDKDVTAYQRRIVEEHPGFMTSAIVRSNWNVDMPDFTGTDEEVQIKRWRYMQQHVFDNMDLADPRLLRTPFLFERIDYYVHKLQVQHPDTIAKAIEYVLEKTRPAEESFRFYLVHFLNEAARSKLVGMDAVYVDLVEKYYKTGQATWTDQESLKKIVENSDALKPLLIGKTAPNITMQRRDGSKIALHDVDSDYTVLYFWRPDCGHCKESTPAMKAFFEKFKDKGVQLFAVCVKLTDEVPSCWQYVDENGLGDWLNTVDPYLLSRFSTLYNIKTTPQIYILDRKKEIITKSIGADQLEEVMDRIIEMKQQEKGKS